MNLIIIGFRLVAALHSCEVGIDGAEDVDSDDFAFCVDAEMGPRELAPWMRTGDTDSAPGEEPSDMPASDECAQF